MESSRGVGDVIRAGSQEIKRRTSWQLTVEGCIARIGSGPFLHRTLAGAITTHGVEWIAVDA